jgi:hypothetical protein
MDADDPAPLEATAEALRPEETVGVMSIDLTR